MTPDQKRALAIQLVGGPGQEFDPRDTSGGPPSGMEGIRRATARDVSYGKNYEMPLGTGKGPATGTLTRRIEPIEKAGPLSGEFRDMFVANAARNLGILNGNVDSHRLMSEGMRRGNPQLLAAGVRLAENESSGSNFSAGLASRERMSADEWAAKERMQGGSLDLRREEMSAEDLRDLRNAELRKQMFGLELDDRREGRQFEGTERGKDRVLRADEAAAQRGLNERELAIKAQMPELEREKIKAGERMGNRQFVQNLLGGAVERGEASLEDALRMGGGDGAPAMGMSKPRLGMTNKDLVADLNKRYGEASSLRNFLDKLPFGYTSPEQQPIVEAFMKQKFGDAYDKFVADDYSHDWFKVGKYDRNKQARLKSKVGVSQRQDQTSPWKTGALGVNPLIGPLVGQLLD